MVRKLVPTGVCWCGCGEATKEDKFFISGHDRRAEAAVIKIEYGGVAEFLDRHGYAPDSPEGLSPMEALARFDRNTPWRYQSLMDYLHAQGILEQKEVTLTFAQIDDLLAKRGESLPPSARAHRPWWANDRTHSHAKAWLDQGWATEKVDMNSEMVTFVRQEYV